MNDLIQMLKNDRGETLNLALLPVAVFVGIWVVKMFLAM